jgi:hypothetical protein
MAEYLGINIVIEGFLLPLAKMSLQVQQRLHSAASRLPPALFRRRRLCPKIGKSTRTRTATRSTSTA